MTIISIVTNIKFIIISFWRSVKNISQTSILIINLKKWNDTYIFNESLDLFFCFDALNISVSVHKSIKKHWPFPYYLVNIKTTKFFFCHNHLFTNLDIIKLSWLSPPIITFVSLIAQNWNQIILQSLFIIKLQAIVENFNLNSLLQLHSNEWTTGRLLKTLYWNHLTCVSIIWCI